MAITLNRALELKAEALNNLRNMQGYTAFLSSAGHTYKYSFQDSLMIHHQKENATAVASYHIWNNTLHRYINRGTSGIALVDADNENIRYVFDISDTHGNKEPYIWQIRNQEYEDRIHKSLCDEFEIEPQSNLMDTLKSILSEFYFDDITEDNLSDLLCESANVTILSRCGYSLEQILESNEIVSLKNKDLFLDKPDSFIEETLKKITDYSRDLLSIIEMHVKTIDKEKIAERSKHNDREAAKENVKDDRQRESGLRPEPENRDIRARRRREKTGRNRSTGQTKEKVSDRELQRSSVPNAGGEQIAFTLHRGGEISRTADRDTSGTDETADNRSNGVRDESEGNQGQNNPRDSIVSAGGIGRNEGITANGNGAVTPAHTNNQGAVETAPFLIEDNTELIQAPYVKVLASNHIELPVGKEYLLYEAEELIKSLELNSNGKEYDIQLDIYYSYDGQNYRYFKPYTIGIGKRGLIADMTATWESFNKRVYKEKGFEIDTVTIGDMERDVIPYLEVNTVPQIDEPYAIVTFTENNTIQEGKYSLSELDRLLIQEDKKIHFDPNRLGYDKTYVTIIYPDGKENNVYSLRYDIGDMDGGLAKHIESYYRYLQENNHYNISDEKFDYVLNSLVPYLKQYSRFSKLNENEIVNHLGHKYIVTYIDTVEDNIKLKDITTPIHTIRSQKLSLFEKELELAGYFNQEEVIQSNEDKPTNFIITDDNLGIGGLKTKYKRNIEAIKLLKQLEQENRLPSKEEQNILSQYVGWGGLANAFDDTKEEWQNEYTELYNLLTPREYILAKESTLDSFYTPPTVIKAMYKALQNMGFSDYCSILEPACGIGNFIGCLPSDMSSSNITGVEIDSISARIAQKLYPNANIINNGYETTQFKDNFFDIAIGNVPFGDIKLYDSKYNHLNYNIHDYFFAKSIDNVREGGVIAFITSKGTLDKANPSVRKYLAKHTELLGAIRLPNNTFQANAGTQVTSDIIFLQKRHKQQELVSPNWIDTGIDENGIVLNQYFIDNPQMILGTMVKETGMYGAVGTTCKPVENKTLAEQLDTAVSYISADIELTSNDLDHNADIIADNNLIPHSDDSIQNFRYCIVDDKLYFKESGYLRKVDVKENVEQRIRSLITVREALEQVMKFQLDGMPLYLIEVAQHQLHKKYNAFYENYGRINSRVNARAFKDDDTYFLLSSLEVLDKDKSFIRKADIFDNITIRPKRVIDRVDTAVEALAVSMTVKGCVDLSYIAKIADITEEEAITELEGLIFKNPLTEEYESHDEYLSGNVREKLSIVTKLKNNPEYASNIKALKEVQPRDLGAEEIHVKLGATWIPEDIITQFIHETFETWNYYKGDINVSYSNYTGEWNVSNKSIDSENVLVNSKYGTSRINAYWIVEKTLNQQEPTVRDTIIGEDGKERRVVNQKETLLAIQKQTVIQEKFQDWIFSDVDRREMLVKKYNKTFNNIALREYDGSHLTFEGMNPAVKLREHQKNAVARQLYGGNTLLAHVVGAGKTYTMIAGAMECKRIGLCSKSLIITPKNVVAQLGKEARYLYPAANILITTAKDFTPANRKRFCSKIATGNYDIIIMSHSQFEKMPLSVERQKEQLEHELDVVTKHMNELKYNGGGGFSVKQAARTKKNIETKLKKLNNQSDKDNVITFEQTGIDRLYVDESQHFKNLYMHTKMHNVAGIQPKQVRKSFDMYLKCQYLNEITNSKGIVFSTGTPLTNSIAEMYTNQRYLQMEELRKRGLEHFDSWAGTFGQTQTSLELGIDGASYRTKTRFNSFYNVPELSNMFRQTADIQTADKLKLPTPKLKTGQVQTILIKPSEIQKNIIKKIGEEAGSSQTNMLVLTTRGRKTAIDQRLVNPLLPDDPNSKINTVMENVHRIWEETAEGRKTQMIFLDMSTPKKGGFSLYADLKQKWIQKGIPEDEIAFSQDYNDVEKTELYNKVNSGEIRILVGSTQSLGAGTNAQERLYALHHVDCPWKPSDLEQREGRILRQGNTNEEVEIFRYITENTFDAYNYV